MQEGPWAPPAAGKDEKRVFFWSFHKGGRCDAGLVRCLGTSVLQNFQKINLCWFKSPSLWQLVTTAIGKKTTSYVSERVCVSVRISVECVWTNVCVRACVCVCLCSCVFQGGCGWHVSDSFMLQSSQRCVLRACLWLCSPWGFSDVYWLFPGSGLVLPFQLRACQTVLAWAASLSFGTSRLDATRTAWLQKLNMGLSGSFWASLELGWVWGPNEGSEATLVYCWPWIIGMPTITCSRQPP